MKRIGIQMGVSEYLQLVSVHAHLNLAGWASRAILLPIADASAAREWTRSRAPQLPMRALGVNAVARDSFGWKLTLGSIARQVLG